uniref:E-selectin n=1 Tax=Sinocyclocheilus anshuiensis TaxID=1608454 RepID=A0A671P1M9_9TELE
MNSSLHYNKLNSDAMQLCLTVKAWTYHYNIDINVDWTAARQWCQKHFTDMVAIQNQAEVEYLNRVLPFNQAYYWIGIRKIDDYWTWVGTKKRLDPEAANWAENEPNNKGSGQDCVEIYIKRRKETAKWNDERCSKKKATVCYLASCSKESCSEHAECVETIGNYRCQCHPGFMGPRCEEGGWSMNCTHPLSINSFNSSCEFKCEEGFELKGSNTTWCDQTGQWTHKPPTCTVVTCNEILAPAKGHLTCADPLGKYSFRSTCNISCVEGHKLRGKATLSCLSDGNWSAPTPDCEVVKCDPLKPIPHGSLQCYDPVEKFAYGSTCWLKCDFGFVHNGTNFTHCTEQGNWSYIPPVCQAIQCSPLSDAPSYGSMTCTHPLSTNSYNSSCEFKCEEGFVLKGADSTHCDHTGHWTHSTPICTGLASVHIILIVLIALNYMKCHLLVYLSLIHVLYYILSVACDPLVTPAKSHLTCADPLEKFSFRSSCKATCEEGYKLRGETTLTCRSDGNWSAPTPACEVIRCDAPESVQHGFVHCQDHLGEFSYGSLCWLECGAGFTLKGSNSTYCTSQGKWSQEFPVCQGNQTLLIISQQCSPLIDPSHGTVICTHPNGQFSFGTVCEVSCQAGFKLHGTPRMECLEMGKWTDAPPFCLGNRSWVFLFHLTHLGSPPSMNCSHPHGNFSFGSQCMFRCAKSHELNGTSQLICSSIGYWTNSPPSCVGKTSVNPSLFMYYSVGAASSAGLLLLGGLMFLLMRQFAKKGNKINDPVPLLA